MLEVSPSPGDGDVTLLAIGRPAQGHVIR
jgi:hypothetical protein